jgi:hypothetical protein
MAGLRLVFGDSTLRRLTLYAWLACFHVAPLGVVVPLTAGHHGGPVAVGLMFAATSIGVAISMTVISRRIPPQRRTRLMTPLSFLAAAPFILCWVDPPLPVTAALWALAGVGAAYQLAANTAFAYPHHSTGAASSRPCQSDGHGSPACRTDRTDAEARPMQRRRYIDTPLTQSTTLAPQGRRPGTGLATIQPSGRRRRSRPLAYTAGAPQQAQDMLAAPVVRADAAGHHRAGTNLAAQTVRLFTVQPDVLTRARSAPFPRLRRLLDTLTGVPAEADSEGILRFTVAGPDGPQRLLLDEIPL